MDETEFFHRRGELLRALLDGHLWKNELAKRLIKVMARKTLMYQLTQLKDEGLITFSNEGRKVMVSLTEKGKNECARWRIFREAGYSGIEWARKYFEKGYKVRFLSDLTGMEKHRKWLFAWNPQTKEADLAAIFGVRSLKGKKGSPRYLAQYVDREKSPTKPIRDAELFAYINEKADDWSEQSISETLREFWNPENFNSYLSLLLPNEEVSFGFPKELGHFSSIAFVGLDFQEHFPFIPKMSLWGGGMNISNNLKIGLSYDLNLMALYSFSYLVAKQFIDPSSVDPTQLREWETKTWLSSFNANTILSCKNKKEDSVNCVKTGIKCFAITENGLDFKRCPILLEDVKGVHLL